MGFRVPCCLASGLKWGPADLKSGASHRGFWWMWTACGPTGRFLRLTLMMRSFLPCVKVAVPASSPVPVLSGTTTDAAGLAKAGEAAIRQRPRAAMEVRMAISPISDAKSEYSRERDESMEGCGIKKSDPPFTMQRVLKVVPVPADPSFLPH